MYHELDSYEMGKRYVLEKYCPLLLISQILKSEKSMAQRLDQAHPFYFKVYSALQFQLTFWHFMKQRTCSTRGHNIPFNSI